jgi:hypothetical protein
MGRASATTLRQKLRYDGQPFSHWRDHWRTELKTELRIESLNALAAFGANGYASEATEAILEVMSEYDQKGSRDKTVLAARNAIHRIGGESVPALVKALLDKRVNVRRFAASSLSMHRNSLSGNAEQLLAASRDRDDDVREEAVGMLSAFGSDPKVRKRLVELATSQDAAAAQAIHSLANSGRSPETAATLLRALGHPDGSVQSAATNSLRSQQSRFPGGLIASRIRQPDLADLHQGVNLAGPPTESARQLVSFIEKTTRANSIEAAAALLSHYGETGKKELALRLSAEGLSDDAKVRLKRAQQIMTEFEERSPQLP